MSPKRLHLALLALVFGCGGAGLSGHRSATPRFSTSGSASLACTSPVPVYEDGRQTRSLCPEEATSQGLTLLDLSTAWAPPMFAEDDPYRQIYARLAERPGVSSGSGDLDRFLASYGVLPAPVVLAEAMLDEARHECHDEVDDSPLDVPDLQAHLRCDGLLAEDHQPGVLDTPTRRALHAFQRRNFLLAGGRVDRATHDLLQASSLERDYQAVLRSLRERVVGATGLIEDGSADNAYGTVFDRYLDPPAARDADRPPMPEAAEDLISVATEKAAEALGWTDPEVTQEHFRSMPRQVLSTLRVAVRLPPPPPHHGEHVELRMEIDRGDVWYEPPFDGDGDDRPHPIERQPVFMLYAIHDGREIPLVRWKTTIGGWRREVGDDGEVGLRYKESPVGTRTIRRMVVAPAWLPPPATPDDELMRRAPDGRWVANRALMERGWGSAFGMVMLEHEKDGEGGPVDEGIRTHGTAEVRSVLGGYSHGCHRLLSHLANRLAGFLVAHRDHERKGLDEVAYERRLEHEGDVDELVIRQRGYVYELAPPLTIDVLPGRIRGERQAPPEGLVDPPSPL